MGRRGRDQREAALKRWSIGAFVVLAIAGFAIARHRTPRPPSRLAPAIVFRPSPPGETRDDASSIEDRAAALAVSSLTPADRKRLLEAIDYGATRLEAQQVPGGNDLGDGDPIAELEGTTKKYLPSLNAARSLVRARSSAKDLSVRLVRSCDDTAIERDERCVALWGAADERGEASRARFLLWAASNAFVFESDRARECAATLREHALDDGSAIALVLSASELGLDPIAERDALKDAVHRLGRALAVSDRRQDEGHELEALGRQPPARGRALAWLESSEKTVVLVPRLSALTRLGELRAAIDAAPTCRPQRWIHRAGE